MKNIKSTSSVPKPSAIIGTYEGEALDTKITNLNGLDITKEVMDSVFSSEEYKEGIANKWYIGYLGHPDDPNYQNFSDGGCIIMTDGWLDSDGKVYGKFDLIDTPTGQIVKKFQDAGVVFGISIRGAGDIIGSQVDPDTFTFRGFDLVTFPAYPESVPKFTAIAASTKPEDRKRYQAVCASIRKNLRGITSCSAIETMQSALAPQSEEYKMLEERKKEIEDEGVVDITQEKVMAMTDLYLSATEEVSALRKQVETLKREKVQATADANRKIRSMERILGSQVENLSYDRDDILDSLEEEKNVSASLNRKLRSVTASLNEEKNQNKILSSRITKCQNDNLIYKQESTQLHNQVREQERVIASLEGDMRETVTANSKLKAQAKITASNRDEVVKLKARIETYEKIICDYQDSYANVYASMIGVSVDSLPITASTTVSQLEKAISGATNTSGISAMPSFDAIVDNNEEDEDLNEIIAV
jgi:hypothetical protein